MKWKCPGKEYPPSIYWSLVDKNLSHLDVTYQIQGCICTSLDIVRISVYKKFVNALNYLKNIM